MRILISAYACRPGKGSEDEVGLQVALTAAAKHEVWVVTREKNLPPLRAFLSSHPLRDRIHLIGLDVVGIPHRFGNQGELGTRHWHYDAWQRQLAKIAACLDAEVDFEIVHHATFAAYWTRVGVAGFNKPLVWGPVGGGVDPPIGLIPVMGLWGAAGDLTRVFARPIVARLFGARCTAVQAQTVFVQNPETARRLRAQNTAVLLPNALLAAHSIPDNQLALSTPGDSPKVVTAGRQIAWKGTALAIAAMRHIQHPGATLEIYGDGPDRRRLERLRKHMGLNHRVRFHGRTERASLMEAFSGAAVLLHPALHEEAGLVVTEALALGTPVVCLDRGGPPVIVGRWPDIPSRVVPASTPGKTARRIARAVDEVIGNRGEADSRPAYQFAEGLLAAYSYAASGR